VLTSAIATSELLVRFCYGPTARLDRTGYNLRLPGLAKLGHARPRVNSAEFGRNELGSYKQKVSTKDEEGAAAVNPDSWHEKEAN
jgi:hypothetical protein